MAGWRRKVQRFAFGALRMTHFSSIHPATPSRPRAPRAHTRFDLSTALPVVKTLARARRRATHLAAPRNEPPSNISLPHRLAQANKPHRTRAASKPLPWVSNPTNTITALHQYSITAKPERRTMPRRYTHTALRAPRNPDAWVCRPFLRQLSGENPGESPSTSTQIRAKKLSASGA